MVEIETFAATIRQYAPIAQLINEPDELRNYDVDGFLPRLVVIPDAVEQGAHIVVLTNHQGLKLLTRGGGSPIKLEGVADQFVILLGSGQVIDSLVDVVTDYASHRQA